MPPWPCFQARAGVWAVPSVRPFSVPPVLCVSMFPCLSVPMSHCLDTVHCVVSWRLYVTRACSVAEMQSMQAAAAAAAVQLGTGGPLSNQALFNTFRSDDRKVRLGPRYSLRTPAAARSHGWLAPARIFRRSRRAVRRSASLPTVLPFTLPHRPGRSAQACMWGESPRPEFGGELTPLSSPSGFTRWGLEKCAGLRVPSERRGKPLAGKGRCDPRYHDVCELACRGRCNWEKPRNGLLLPPPPVSGKLTVSR